MHITSCANQSACIVFTFPNDCSFSKIHCTFKSYCLDFPPTNNSSFLIGQSAGAADQAASKSPWVYVTIDGVLQSCRLFVYNVGNHDNNKTFLEY